MNEQKRDWITIQEEDRAKSFLAYRELEKMIDDTRWLLEGKAEEAGGSDFTVKVDGKEFPLTDGTPLDGVNLLAAALKMRIANEKKLLLKPCPFCGGEAELENMGVPHHVYCTKCGANTVSTLPGEDGEIAAVAKWNRRSEAEE